MYKWMFALFFIVIMTACATPIETPQNNTEDTGCAQDNYGNPNYCNGYSEGDKVLSCDCNTCTCVKENDGNLYPACTEMACDTPAQVSNYTTEPFMECVECDNGKTWDNKPCCTDHFENDCLAANGVVRWSDLHPVFTVLKGCFQKAPDTGKECASAVDCMSGVCDLENGITSNKCMLIKNESIDIDYGSLAYRDDYYKTTYSCTTTKPGICTETIENRINPGGVEHYFTMNDSVLTEYLEPGPIY